ncbi:MAG TPA: transcription elongation factor GreA, partial [Anaerolineae bacterium]|nr:transcription elongation factor GreA [Anaerolineae bacterium]
MAKNDTFYLTREGLQRLQKELEYLIRVKRPEIARQIAEAKAGGDIPENA